MASDFGLKIGLEGEKEFKSALSEISQSFKVLGSEMNLVTSQFDSNNKSVESLTSKNTILNNSNTGNNKPFDHLPSVVVTKREIQRRRPSSKTFHR